MLQMLRSLAQLVGIVVITLFTLYGTLAFLGNYELASAAFDELEIDLLSGRTVAATADVAPVPSAFNYRGTLRDSNGNLVANGEYTLTFRIYGSIGASTSVFTQTQPGIIVRDGNFNTTISEIPTATFTESADRFIGVTIEPLAEMVPRERLASVPYAVQAVDAHNGVPVGGVVDWWRPNDSVPIPDGFVACDGSVVDDALSPYNGFATPDLRGRMVRGAAASVDEGVQGGVISTTLNAATFLNGHVVGTPSTSANGAHAHSNGGATGGVTAGVAEPGKYDYQVYSESGTWNTSYRIGTIAGGAVSNGSNGAGNHRHTLPNTSTEPAHSHTVDVGTLNHSGSVTFDNQPPFHNLLKICRIR